eukprot:TRINITY_DN57060_c0_g1_i1.p1 TRINITY_DN57060_c0_g1~~TRINITY_DN57060_c0_g1_i1.p1  ORF type:complete len:331 (+),score=84.60 TRINITY_DN57060_c0_g1_i1:77-1069(+)
MSTGQQPDGLAVPSVEELAGFRSKFVDVSRVPPASLGHLQQMLQSSYQRRQAARAASPEAAYAAVAADAAEERAAGVLSDLADEETLGRRLAGRTEESARAEIVEAERAARDIASGSKEKRRLARRRRKELRRLEELKQREFHRAWLASRRAAERGAPLPPPEPTPAEAAAMLAEVEEQRRRVTEVNTATRRLRMLYSDSAPPFPADPSELWARGVVLPPERQLSPQRKARAAGLEGAERLPAESYHEFATRLRRAYWQQRIDRDARDRESAFLAACDRAPEAPPPALPLRPGQGEFTQALSRAQHELCHGPMEGWPPPPPTSSERPPWR